jgi:hypothetical protein
MKIGQTYLRHPYYLSPRKLGAQFPSWLIRVSHLVSANLTEVAVKLPIAVASLGENGPVPSAKIASHQSPVKPEHNCGRTVTGQVG